MNTENDFYTAAQAATASLDFDPERTLAGVQRRQRRRRAQRFGFRAVPAALALGVAAALGPGLITDNGKPLAPYAFAAAPLPATPAADVDGVLIGNLPDGMTLGSPVREHNDPSPAAVTVTIRDKSDGEEIVVSVARAQGLTLEKYLKTNWFRGTATTVSNRPALANSVQSDDAAGLVWSPEDGVIIEAHADADRAAELRELVENMHLQ